MPYVRFTRDFDYHIPGKLVTLAFKAGQEKLIVTPAANAAIAAGAAVMAKRKPRHAGKDQGG